MIWEALAPAKLVSRTDDETAMLARRLSRPDPPILGRGRRRAGRSHRDLREAMASNPENRYATALGL